MKLLNGNEIIAKPYQEEDRESAAISLIRLNPMCCF